MTPVKTIIENATIANLAVAQGTISVIKEHGERAALCLFKHLKNRKSNQDAKTKN